MTLGELVEKLAGQLMRGSPETSISGVAHVASARPGQLLFAETHASAVTSIRSEASAVVVQTGEAKFLPDVKGGPAVIEADQPRLWFSKASSLLSLNLTLAGIHPSAVLHPECRIGEGVFIGACAVLEQGCHIGRYSHIGAGAIVCESVRIGQHCRIYPRVVIYPGTTLGDRVVVHAGAVLGADGFGYVRDRTTGAYTQFPQRGTLQVEDDVEIGANTTIDRGALEETRIRRGVKLDNLVHIGHNCDIGEDVVMASLTGISGSSTVGKGAILAGQVGIGDHAHIGPGVILGGQAGVLSGKTVSTTGVVLWGTPAKPIREHLRELAILSRLAKKRKE